MSPMCRRFQRLLAVELESLRDELEILVEHQERRLADHEITDYVRNLNVSTLQHEIIGLEHFLKVESCEDAEDAGDPHALAEAAKTVLSEYAAHHDLVPALSELMKRRIEKVAAYLVEFPVEVS